MPLPVGTRIGHYEITAAIGAGGMGEVYRARDTRLDRSVAIKVLPNAALRERFEREARVISSLSHPHICTLFDVGDDYLVMEYIEGETLADRLLRGPLPVEQVLRFGTQIAGALAAAHRHGIVHRDLKPGNIMLTRSGVKLLDFGLAKYAKVDTEILHSATEQKPLTEEGTILGTFQYMSPEQIEAGNVDARSDIFALGAVLYEMAAGRRAFEGKSKTSIIAAILDREPPPVSSLQPLAPPALERVIRTCLAKNPEDRWHSAHDIAAELRWIGEGGRAVPGPATRHAREWVAWSLVAALTVGLIAAVVLLSRSRTARPDPIESSVLMPKTTAFFTGGIALSPDGRRLAFIAANESGRDVLWIRSLRGGQAQPVAGSEDATLPFWSPNSQFVGFFAAGKLKKVDAQGGPAQTICNVNSPRGGAWNRHNVILVAVVRDGLYQVSATGGELTRVSKPEGDEADHRWPFFLPDDEHYLFLARAENPEESSVYAGRLGSTEKKRLTIAASNAMFANDYLLFVRERVLLAQRFDARKLTLEGEPKPVAEALQYVPGTAFAIYSASGNGSLVYARGNRLSRLVWYDRGGKALGQLGPPADYLSVALSPDDRRLATDIDDNTGRSDIWIFDLQQATSARFTFKPFAERGPVWSPDGKMIAYEEREKPPWSRVVVKALGAAVEQPLWEEPGSQKIPFGWTRDGKVLVSLNAPQKKIVFDLWTYSIADHKAVPVVQGPASESAGSISPDGKWIAYASNESGGRSEIYVQPVSGAGKWQISTGGGVAPRWSRRGDEIFYFTESKLMSVPVHTEPTLEFSAPRPLFSARIKPLPGLTYDVTADGQRFLLNVISDEAAAQPVTLLTNWTGLVEAPDRPPR